MKIQVTQEHINKGVRGSCAWDPLCLALEAAGFYRPWVSPNGIHVFGVFGSRSNIQSRNYQLPYGVRQFMLDFDNGKKVVPFTFELEG